MSDPLLRLISSGLRLWIASCCDQVGEMDLTLRGSSLSLLQGRLEGVDLKARQDVGVAGSFPGERHGDVARL